MVSCNCWTAIHLTPCTNSVYGSKFLKSLIMLLAESAGRKKLAGCVPRQAVNLPLIGKKKTRQLGHLIGVLIWTILRERSFSVFFHCRCVGSNSCRLSFSSYVNHHISLSNIQFSFILRARPDMWGSRATLKETHPSRPGLQHRSDWYSIDILQQALILRITPF